MTIEEANIFLREAFIAFPGVLQWVKDNSPDPKQTLQLWAKNLERISTAEAISVLNRWNANEIPPPSGYQRELFINHVIAVVQKDRSKNYAARHREEVFEQLNLKQPKGNYNAVCGPFMSDVLGLKASYDLGQISFEELTKQVEERKQQAMDSVK
jgi:hypothetical protein